MLDQRSALSPIVHDSLTGSQRIRHGFFTRAGGISQGVYKGLNVGLGSGDDKGHVRENRNRIASEFQVHHDQLVTPFQVHSPHVWTASATDTIASRPEADAVVTRAPGIAIGILTADCGPVLFADHKNHVIGAAHAGWKGATGGVLENTIEAMEKLGADRKSISAVLGPTISQENYEVGPEFIERLLGLHSDNQRYLTVSNQPGHAMFDLPSYIVDRLNKNGIAASWSGHCTYKAEDDFYSYRRKTHRGEPDYGRQISAISITGSAD